jgi:septal ring factor EnvC (AmiA/AmiB activator)
MKYEDLLSQWQRTKETLDCFEDKIEMERKKYREYAPQFDQKLEHAERELIEVRSHLEQQLNNRQMELDHEREKNRNLKDILEDLETKMAGTQPIAAPENYNYK